MGFPAAQSVWTDHREKYKELSEEYSDFFPKEADIFNISAAIGIKHGEGEKVSEKKLEVGKAGIVDRDEALYILLKVKYPELTDKERLEKLQSFAEYGIQVLYDKVTSMGTYNPGAL